MSIPEPAPKPEGVIVTGELVSWIEKQDVTDTERDRAIKLIKERDEYGFKKYGQHLMTKDGRNSIEDALQELGDLMHYLYKARLNGEDISEIRVLFPLLALLVD